MRFWKVDELSALRREVTEDQIDARLREFQKVFDVQDLCQNQRRDFHMQYGVVLPTRIYPGQYQLRLTITDQLSHKIGQASVPFEIVD